MSIVEKNTPIPEITFSPAFDVETMHDMEANRNAKDKDMGITRRVVLLILTKPQPEVLEIARENPEMACNMLEGATDLEEQLQAELEVATAAKARLFWALDTVANDTAPQVVENAEAS